MLLSLNQAVMPKRLTAFLYCMLTITTCFGQQKQLRTLADPASRIKDHEIRSLIDSLDTALNRWYVYSGKVPIMLANVKKNYKKGVYNHVTDRSELASR